MGRSFKGPRQPVRGLESTMEDQSMLVELRLTRNRTRSTLACSVSASGSRTEAQACNSKPFANGSVVLEAGMRLSPASDWVRRLGIGWGWRRRHSPAPEHCPYTYRLFDRKCDDDDE